MSAVLVIARILFAFIFLTSGFNHLAKLEAMTGYAKYKKLPAAKLSVALSGVIMILGALSVIFGYYVDLGAILIIVFLVPASLIFHNFWTLTDPAAKQNDMIQFFKNVTAIGGALVIYGYVHFIATLYKDGGQLAAAVAPAKPYVDGVLQGFGWVISQGHLTLWK